MHDKLNIGCGNRFLPDWENLDFRPTSPDVRDWDIRRGLPYAADTFGLVYMSHVLEHMTPEAAEALVKECRRVLQPGGILRIVVPDLEAFAQNYLAALRATREASDDEARERYEWCLLLLIDQLVRTRPGGRLAARLGEYDGELPDYVRAHFSDVWTVGVLGTPPAAIENPTFRQRLVTAFRWRRRAFVERLRGTIARRLPRLSDLVERLEMASYLGQGERHHWMYDEFGLRCLLEECSFGSVTRRSCSEGAVFQDDIRRLDMTEEGTPYIPDSLYMEGEKGERGV